MAQRSQDMWNMILPYIISRRFEKQRIEDYLQKSLTEYEAYGNVQKEIQDRAILNRLLESFFEPSMFKDYPYQAYAYADMMKKILPSHLTKQLNLPDNYESMIRTAQEATARSVQSMQETQPLKQEDIATLVRGYGHKMPSDMVKQIQKIEGEVAGRGVREKELGVEKEKIQLERDKLEFEKGGKGKESLKERLLNLGKKETIFANKLKETEAYSIEGEEGDEFKKVAADLEGVRKERLNIINQLIGELDKAKVDKILSKLKKGGATPEALESNKAELMKAEGLTDIEFEYLKINLGK